MPISYLEYSSASIAPKTLKEREWAWQRHTASSRNTEVASGRRPNWTREQPFISHSAASRSLSPKTQPPQPEDNHEFERRHTLGGRHQDDIDLALHALRQGKLANSIFVVRDGEEALDFIFCRGQYSQRSVDHPPKLVLLDLKLPKVDGLQVLKALKGDPRTKTIPIVIMTSSKEERDMVESYNSGVNSYIQ